MTAKPKGRREPRNRIPIVALIAFFSLGAAVAFADPPYDVTVDVTAPADGGAVDTYELFLDGVSQGAVVEGPNTFPGLLTADGTYTFRVDATNAAGTTLGDPVTVTVSELQLPGTTTITIQVNCDPCTVIEQ